MGLQEVIHGAAEAAEKLAERVEDVFLVAEAAVVRSVRTVFETLTTVPLVEGVAFSDEEGAGPSGETLESLSSSAQELYDRSSQLYVKVSHCPAQGHESCTAQLTEWLSKQPVERDELERMRAVFSKRAERNNRGSELSGSAAGSLCSEGFKYGWILSALERRLGELDG
jgi:hypothetical protein